MDNMKIWNAVSKTDPKYTKNAKLKGGFSVTAINATYQAQQMTNQFGVYGTGWGLENVHYEIVELSNDFHDNVLVFKADLFYFIEDKKGIIPIDAEIDIWEYSRKYKSWAKNNDMHKKVKTDAMTKGFSLLGLSADVFMGLYDDNKYLNEVKHEFDPSYTEKVEKKFDGEQVDSKSKVTQITNNIVRSYISHPRLKSDLKIEELKVKLNSKELLANQFLVDELIKEYGSLESLNG